MHETLRAIPLRVVLSSLGYEKYSKRKGKEEWTGVCPVHKGTTNSFSFTDQKFKCFSCGVGGVGAIDLVLAFKKVKFHEAIDYLRTIPVVQTNQPISFNYEKYYEPNEWLLNKVPKEVLDIYGVGVYNNPLRQSSYSGKLMFPIHNFNGEKVGYIARSPNDADETYIFPPRFIKHVELYGAYQIKSYLEQTGQARLPLGYIVSSPLEVLEYRSRGFFAVWCLSFLDGHASASVSLEQGQMIEELFESVIYLLPPPVPILNVWVQFQ